jgi:hypothetical protein
LNAHESPENSGNTASNAAPDPGQPVESGPSLTSSARPAAHEGPTRDALVSAMVRATLADQHAVAALYAAEIAKLDAAAVTPAPANVIQLRPSR